MEKDVKEDTRPVKISFLLNLLSERVSRSHCRERADHDAAEVSWTPSGTRPNIASCGFICKNNIVYNCLCPSDIISELEET